MSQLFNWLDRGWSQNFYVESTEHEQAVIPFLPLEQLQQGIMAEGVILEAYRVSDVAIDGDGFPKDVNIVGTPPALDLPVQQIETCVLFNLVAENGSRRQLYIHGFPDAWVIWNDSRTKATPNPDLQTFIDQYINALQDSPVRVRTINKANVKKPIIDAGPDPDDPNRSLLTFAVDPGFSVGDQIKIYGLPRWPYCDFLKPTYVVDKEANTITVPIAWPSGVEYKANGKARKIESVYLPLSRIEQKGIRKRDVGRAFFVPAGRSPKTIKC